MKFIGIIPARFGSTRFPGKPLADIHGMSMIQRVVTQVEKVLDDVYVATDDQRISDHVLSFGGKVLMTSSDHRSGTDRCREALGKAMAASGKNWEVVINIQGDEPFIQPEQIQLLMDCFSSEHTDIATLIKKIDRKEDLHNPNIPKVMINRFSEALYFSRSTVPYLRGTAPDEWFGKTEWFKHIGIYAYRTEVLEAITKLEPAPPEIAESLEQLRWLWNGFKIKTAVTSTENLAVDTPEDLERVLKIMNQE
jgi:3-deoxy-manno-octulosonate cytidylyltransferase (CMP-KDO synthetase)